MDKKYPLKYSSLHPYNRYTDYLQSIFGKRMQKISIDAGFTCPNIDGTLSKGGCIYCNNFSFNPNYKYEQQNISKQIDKGISKFTNRKPGTGFIAYFQSHTNTHGKIDELHEIYQKAVDHPQIEGLMISTRPDCLENEVINLLKEFNQQLFTGVEIGIESTLDETLSNINRGHTFDQTLDTIQRVKNAGLHIGGHLILGLPGETKQDILSHAEKLARTPLDTVKLHQLQIIKNTQLAMQFANYPSQIRLFPLEEYIDLCISFTERLNRNIVIERFASESKPDLLAVKMWGGVKNHQIADMISNEMRKRNTWQGKHFEE
jgi:radical SAM protein (TIGR01212 family)